MGEEAFDEVRVPAKGGEEVVVRGGYGRREITIGIAPSLRERELWERSYRTLLAVRSNPILAHAIWCAYLAAPGIAACCCGLAPLIADIDNALSWPKPREATSDEPLCLATLNQKQQASLREAVRGMQRPGMYRWP